MRCTDAEARALVADAAYYAGIVSNINPRAARPNHMLCGKATSRKRKVFGSKKVPPRRIAPATLSELHAIGQEKHNSLQTMQSSDSITALTVKALSDVQTAFAQALSCTHQTVRNKDAFVPVSTVENDNLNLQWGRKGVPLCSAKQACDAMHLPFSQGPLHAFLLPGQQPEEGTLCLMCLRVHAEMINAHLNVIDTTGKTGCMMPPFTNLVNVAGGYHDWSLGVTAVGQRIFDRQCSIVGSSSKLAVRYSPEQQKWWVDQSALVWQPSKTPDF